MPDSNRPLIASSTQHAARRMPSAVGRVAAAVELRRWKRSGVFGAGGVEDDAASELDGGVLGGGAVLARAGDILRTADAAAEAAAFIGREQLVVATQFSSAKASHTQTRGASELEGHSSAS